MGIFFAQGMSLSLTHADTFSGNGLQNLPDGAKRDLQNQGWKKGSDGKWTGLNGEPLLSVTERIGAGEHADKVSGRQKIAAGIGAAKGAFAAVKAAGCCAAVPMKTACCILYGAASSDLFRIADIFGKNSKKSRDIARQWRGGDPASPNTPPPPPGPPGPPGSEEPPTTTSPPVPVVTIPTPGGEPERVKLDKPGIKKFLKNNDITWDTEDNTLTMPNGQTFSPGQKVRGHSVPESVSKKFNQQAQKIADQVKAHYAAQEQQAREKAGKGILKKTAGYGGGGGFKGYGKRKPSRSSDSDSLSSLSGLKNNRTPSSQAQNHLDKASGMSVRHGTDRIGVSEDNIFAIMHRQYQSQRGKKLFQETSL